MNENTKKCKYCKQIKSTNEFVKILSFRRNCCEICYQSDLLKKQREKDQKAIQCREKWLCDYERHGRKWNINYLLYNSAKQRAKNYGIPFTLKKEDVIVTEYCPILGIKLKKCRGPMCENSPTIDRIYPEKGYTKENICVISSKANRLKSNSTIEEMKKVIEYMERHTRA